MAHPYRVPLLHHFCEPHWAANTMCSQSGMARALRSVRQPAARWGSSLGRATLLKGVHSGSGGLAGGCQQELFCFISFHRDLLAFSQARISFAVHP